MFQSGKIALKGFVAWVAHRGYHGLAMPSWERKFRVVWGWWNNLWLGRDLVNLETVQNPRYVFEEFAARPHPAADAPAPPAVAQTATDSDGEERSSLISSDSAILPPRSDETEARIPDTAGVSR